MNLEDKNHFKSKLIQEKCNLENIISRIQDSYALNNEEMNGDGPNMFQNSSEESVEELYDKENGISLQNNESILIRKIENALKAIENGSYGNCKICKKEISKERLDVVPYTEYCIDCQRIVNERAKAEECISKEKEARIANSRFVKSSDFYNDYGNIVYSVGNSYDKVEINSMDDVFEREEQGYVEPIEMISNEQYRDSIQ